MNGRSRFVLPHLVPLVLHEVRTVGAARGLLLIAFDCHLSLYEPGVSYISCILTVEMMHARL